MISKLAKAASAAAAADSGPDSFVSSPCCYKAVDAPPPGAWLSIEPEDPSRPFCVEPDSLRRRGKGGEGQSKAKSEEEEDSPEGRLRHALAMDHDRCDSDYPPPSAALNVTSAAVDEWEAWQHAHANTTIFEHIQDLAGRSGGGVDGAEGGGEGDEDDDLLFTSMAKWWKRLGSKMGVVSNAASDTPSRAVTLWVSGLLILLLRML